MPQFSYKKTIPMVGKRRLEWLVLLAGGPKDGDVLPLVRISSVAGKGRTARAVIFSLLLLFFILSLMAYESQSLSFAVDGQDKDIAAKIADQIITYRDLEAPLTSRIYELEQEIYRLKRDRLERMILKMLLQEEADRLGISSQKLVDDQVLSRGVVVSEDEVEQYYQENKASFEEWSGSEADLKQQVSALIGQRKGYLRVMDYAESLKSKYQVIVYLKEPARPHVDVPLDDDPSWGPPDAPVTIVEFSDYECPACRKYHEVVQAIRKTYQGQVRWVFKDYPLKGHKWSRIAAEAARCADEQGKFWEYQDLLFNTDGELSDGRLKSYAEALGLDMDSFNRCYSSGKFLSKIERDLEEAQKIGINMTPSYVINGTMIPGGPPIQDLTRIMEDELLKAKKNN